MSAEQDRIRALAERIAGRLEREDVRADGTQTASGAGGDDEIGQLREGLRELQQRLERIESHVGRDEARGRESEGREVADAPPQHPALRPESQSAPQPPRWTSSIYVSAAHPSQERFDVGEAVSELVDFFESEKKCNVEPGDKPCDHCAMCSSRGF